MDIGHGHARKPSIDKGGGFCCSEKMTTKRSTLPMIEVSCIRICEGFGLIELGVDGVSMDFGARGRDAYARRRWGKPYPL